MSEVPIVRARLFDALHGISEGCEEASDLTRALRKALLDFGSETPDNLNCAERIEVATISDGAALKISGRAILLSEIAHMAEDQPMPASVSEAFPDLTEADWDAFTRLTTLLYILLEPYERQSE